MPNRKAKVTQSEITRALKAARLAGYSVPKFEILEEGGLRIFLGEEHAEEIANEWDVGLRVI